MRKLNKGSLEFDLFQKTGGRWSPEAIKQFMAILEEWLPKAEVPGFNDDIYEREFKKGWNAYKAAILDNLK